MLLFLLITHHIAFVTNDLPCCARAHQFTHSHPTNFSCSLNDFSPPPSNRWLPLPPSMGKRGCIRLAALRKAGCDIIVTVDTVAQADAISAAMHAVGTRVRCILEVDIGMGRAGVQPCAPEDVTSGGEPAAKKAKADVPAAVTLALAIDGLPGTEFVGLMGCVMSCCCSILVLLLF